MLFIAPSASRKDGTYIIICCNVTAALSAISDVRARSEASLRNWKSSYHAQPHASFQFNWNLYRARKRLTQTKNEHFWEKPQAIKISVSPFSRYNFKINSFLTVVPERKGQKDKQEGNVLPKRKCQEERKSHLKQFVGITGKWTVKHKSILAGRLCWLKTSFSASFFLTSNQLFRHTSM